MFVQYLLYVILVIGFAYLAWRFIVKKLLIAYGYISEETKPIKTPDTKRLKKTKNKYAEKIASAKAIYQEKKMARRIKAVDQYIEKAKNEIDN